jgi:transposase
MNNTFIIRKNVGIDISKDTFVSSVGYLDSTQEIRIVSTKTFPNQPNGFEQLLSWTNSFGEQSIPVSFVMEATGVYYEPLAYFLFQKQFNIHVILPNVYKTFAQSLNIKSKTDKIDAQILCRLG